MRSAAAEAFGAAGARSIVGIGLLTVANGARNSTKGVTSSCQTAERPPMKTKPGRTPTRAMSTFTASNP